MGGLTANADDRCGAPPLEARRSRAQRHRARLRRGLFLTGAAAGLPPGLVDLYDDPMKKPQVFDAKSDDHFSFTRYEMMHKRGKSDKAMLASVSDGDIIEPKIHDVPKNLYHGKSDKAMLVNVSDGDSIESKSNGILCSNCAVKTPHVVSEKYGDYFCFKCHETMHKRGKSDKAMLASVSDSDIIEPKIHEVTKNLHHGKSDKAMLVNVSDGDSIESNIHDVPKNLHVSELDGTSNGIICFNCAVKTPHVGSEKYGDYVCFKCHVTMHKRGESDKAMLASVSEGVDATNTNEYVKTDTETQIDTYAEEELEGEVEDDAIPLDIYDAFVHECSDAIVDLTLSTSGEIVTAALERTTAETASHPLWDSADALWAINRLAMQHIQMLNDPRLYDPLDPPPSDSRAFCSE